jgi:hypothetical protein
MEAYRYNLTARQLQRGLSYNGDLSRLRIAVQKLIDGAVCLVSTVSHAAMSLPAWCSVFGAPTFGLNTMLLSVEKNGGECSRGGCGWCLR